MSGRRGSVRAAGEARRALGSAAESFWCRRERAGGHSETRRPAEVQSRDAAREFRWRRAEAENGRRENCEIVNLKVSYAKVKIYSRRPNGTCARQSSSERSETSQAKSENSHATDGEVERRL